MLPEKLAFVDIETTGLSVTSDRIIEIGIVRLENNKIRKTFSTLVNPQTFISPVIFSMTGIVQKDIDSAPEFSAIAEQVREILEDAIFVAHNVRFDYGFIRNEFLRNGSSFSAKQFCTVKLSKFLFPSHTRHNLDAIINRFNLSCEQRHRAFDDAKVLVDFYLILQKEVEREILAKAVDSVMKKTTVPSSIDQDEITNLPETPGVYVFYGENGVPLYVGKSINIKERVMSHFSNDYTSSKEMKISQQIKSIETFQTAGELGALMKESQLVKELQPLYNRKLRMAKKLIILRKYTNANGYAALSMEIVQSLRISDITSVVGVYRSERLAKEFLIPLVKDHNLCEKLLGLQKTSGTCFAYRLGYCHGACTGKESAIRYNIRFLESLSEHAIKPWPFPGPIVISEKREEGRYMESFIIDKWCLLGNVKSDEDASNETFLHDYQFDLDTYKILLQYLKKTKHLVNIRPFSHANKALTLQKKTAEYSLSGQGDK